MAQPYDPVGAMGGMFAPAYIHGNPESEAAVQKWQADNFAMTNPGVEATRGPAQTITNAGMGGFGRGAPTTTTIPGAIDPEALRILAQGGHYTPRAAPVAPPAAGGGTVAPTSPRDRIAQALIDRDMMLGQGIGQRGGYPWGQIGPNVTS